MPYLYHTGEYHPGMFTLETSRSATGVMAALANLLLLGKDGFRTLIGHAVEMAEVLRELIISRPELSVLNDQNYGPVTLFRAYPPRRRYVPRQAARAERPVVRRRAAQHNELNRRIFQRVAAEALAGRGVAIGFTDNYRTSDSGEPICALKSYVLSPFADEAADARRGRTRAGGLPRRVAPKAATMVAVHRSRSVWCLVFGVWCPPKHETLNTEHSGFGNRF